MTVTSQSFFFCNSICCYTNANRTGEAGTDGPSQTWHVHGTHTTALALESQGGVQFLITFGTISYHLYSVVFCSVFCCILKNLRNTLYSAVF